MRERFPAVDHSHLDLAGSELRPEQHWHGLGAGQQGLGLDPAPELVVEPLDRVGRSRGFGPFQATRIKIVEVRARNARKLVMPRGAAYQGGVESPSILCREKDMPHARDYHHSTARSIGI